MKLPLLLFALILSVQGWCANAIPSKRAARAITPGYQTVENEKLQEKKSRPLLSDKMKTAMIGWIGLTYLTALIWWAIVTKNSLDKILKDVLRNSMEE